MQFEGTLFIDIDQLGLSQIYLNSKKIAAVKEWFDPQDLTNFEPLPVHDFGNHQYTLTDGHTRAFVAYQSGLRALPVHYDTDDIVTCPTGQMLYRADIEWCRRFQITHISHLQTRIVDEAAYEKLWIARCDRSHDLLTQTTPADRARLQSFAPHLFLYGASADLSILFFENIAGERYLFKDNILLPE